MKSLQESPQGLVILQRAKHLKPGVPVAFHVSCPHSSRRQRSSILVLVQPQTCCLNLSQALSSRGLDSPSSPGQ